MSAADGLIRHLPYFIAVAEEENFQRAATRLNIVQPALSRRVQDLEHALGVQLFERLPRGVRLSPAGRSLLREGKQVLEAFERACKQCARVASGEIGSLRIGFNDVALKIPLVSAALRSFTGQSAEIELRPLPMLSQAQQDALRAGEIDAGLLYLAPDELAEFETLPLLTDDFVLALAAGHPLAARPGLTLADLREVPFLWPSRTAGRVLYDRMISACEQRGVSPRIMMEVLNADSTLSVVASGIAVGFVPRSQAAHLPPGVLARPVADFSVPMQFVLAWLRGAASPVLARLVALMAESLRDAAPSH